VSSTLRVPASTVRVALWRHGQTAWNAEGRYQGQTDIELDALGEAQVVASAEVLARLEPSLLVSSDLLRARRTADALAAVTGLPVRLDPDLRETHGGAFQGLTGEEIRQRHPREWAALRQGDPYVQTAGGEARIEVSARMLRAVERAIGELEPGGLAVLATHGGAARLAVARLIGLPLERVGALGVISNAAWTLLERRAEPEGITWALVEHNARSLPEPVTIEEG
jgi:probable phosphoglycerate mutase